MWRVALLVAVVVLFGIAEGEIIDDYELSKMDQELELEDEFNEEVQKSIQRDRNRRNPFLHRRGVITSLVAQQPSPEDLPSGRHPAVTKKLQRMDGEMRSLQSRHHLATQARENLESDVKNALKHMNEVGTIKSQLAHTEVQIRSEERKLKRLESDRLRLDRTRHSLVSSLHHIMEPKIEFAKDRLHKREEDLREKQDKVAEWKVKEDEYHAASLTELVARDKSKDHVAAAAEAEEKAHKEWIMAEKELHSTKQNARLDIQHYEYSQAEARAAMSQEQRAEEHTREAEASVKRLNHILNMEQSRVDESMAIGKDRVEGKIRELAKDEQKSHAMLDELKHKYIDWQQTGSKWANHVASERFSTEFAAKHYADSQRAVLDSARDQVVFDAESDSDNDWADWTKE